MSFTCGNLIEKTGMCQRLNKPCVVGRPGCVAQGKFKFSKPLEERIREADSRFIKRR